MLTCVQHFVAFVSENVENLSQQSGIPGVPYFKGAVFTGYRRRHALAMKVHAEQATTEARKELALSENPVARTMEKLLNTVVPHTAHSCSLSSFMPHFPHATASRRQTSSLSTSALPTASPTTTLRIRVSGILLNRT